MIVARTASGYRFVTQPDHAALAGQFADAWGAGAFGRPEPFAAVAMAARRHDDGWADYDRRPHLDDDGAPVDFRETPPETWIPIYDRGVDAVARSDRYAGLLVSMHGTGLRRRRYGLSPSWGETPPAYAGFVERQEGRQAELARSMHDDEADGRIAAADLATLATLHETGGPPDGTGSRLWRNYQLLQAWDVLSLAFCITVSPPGFDRVGPVPTRGGGEAVTLTVAGEGDGTFRVEPYPFEEVPLEVSVQTRAVRQDGYDGEEGLARAYDAAAEVVEAFALVA